MSHIRQKQKAIIIDVDGTLADVTYARRHILPKHPEFSGKKDFEAFHLEACSSDPIWTTVDIIDAMYIDYRVHIITARKEIWRNHTVDWMQRNHIRYDFLHMRANNDGRKDVEVKRDILNELKEKYDFELAVDDNPHICEMFEQEGIRTMLIPGWIKD